MGNNYFCFGLYKILGFPNVQQTQELYAVFHLKDEKIKLMCDSLITLDFYWML